MPTRVLFLCHRFPYPPNKGDKIRSFNILKYLTHTNTVILGCLIDNKKDLQYVSTLEKHTKRIFYDHFSPKTKKVISLIKAMCTRKPISVPYFYSKNLQAALDTFIEANPVDIVFCSSSPSAEYVFRSKHYQGSLKKAYWVMDFIDFDSHKWQQYAARKNIFLSLIYNREASYLLEYEKRITKEFNQLLLVSEEEKSLFQHYIQTEKIHAISNGVDLDFFNPGHVSAIKLKSPALVFTGAMDYWPNINGAIWFVQKVLPRIQTILPEASLYIVGSNPSKRLKQLQTQNSVTVTGFVNDVRDYIAEADICVIPLHIARGLQNKVLEAMAMGKAVVSTPEAAEGLNIHSENDICIQKDEIAFASTVISLLQNKEAASLLGRNARKAMEKNYSWDNNLRLLDAVLNSSTQTV
jgi:polysaccharide biosynthesis protein PslH